MLLLAALMIPLQTACESSSSPESNAASEDSKTSDTNPKASQATEPTVEKDSSTAAVNPETPAEKS
ncbi:MAG: hypothetical protein KDA70_14580, partial [Planctomycetaceae bacterium]|nr:hypothetical protein [Planctomycetaceae bacterium]